MTLILTAATADFIVQVSDRRLTLPDGSLFDDFANKALVASCADSRFTISYTGLARIDGSTRTDRWLVEHLSRGSIETLTLDQVAVSIQLAAGAALHRSNVARQYRGITFVLAGYRHDTPFVWRISNREDSEFRVLPTVSDEFGSFPLYRTAANGLNESTLFFNGETRAIEGTIDRRLTKINRNSFRAPIGVVIRMMVDLARAAGRHPIYGMRIGRDCASVAITTGIDCFCDYFPAEGAPLAFLPHVIVRGMSFNDVTIDSKEGGIPVMMIDNSGFYLATGKECDVSTAVYMHPMPNGETTAGTFVPTIENIPLPTLPGAPGK
jgi:hypothetical protein